MKIAVIQMTSGLEPEVNLEKIDSFLKEAVEKKSQCVFLPEVFLSMSDGITPTPHIVENGNHYFNEIATLAKKYQVYLIGGSASTLNKDGGLPKNRAYNLNPNGELINTYDKIHLFSCDLSKTESKKIIDEHNIYSKGSEKQTVEIDDWKIGISVCFDLRFPEMFREYSKKLMCNVLSCSAAFTVPTGKAHWETLLRARAIENQCYVVASAQWGQNNQKISTYGHSMIIDPWGEVISNAGEGEKIIYGEFNLAYLNEVRSRLKVLCD